MLFQFIYVSKDLQPQGMTYFECQIRLPPVSAYCGILILQVLIFVFVFIVL